MSLAIKCDCCKAVYQSTTNFPGQAILEAKRDGWTSTFHFLWNKNDSREHCPDCSKDEALRPPLGPAEPPLGYKYRRV